MSDFNDRPFVAGSLVGLRAFRVDSLGRLRAVTRSAIFPPGENVASCEPNMSWSTFDFLPSRLAFSHGGPVAWVSKEPEKPKKEHVVAGRDCGCGFYAYFDGSQHDQASKRDGIAAIIEGYGVCTVGSKGFRASKARLVALVAPMRLARWDLVLWIFIGLCAFANLVMCAVGLAHGNWLPALGSAAVAVIAAWTTRLTFRRARPDWWAKVRRNYPDVPVYRSTRAALKAHPVTAMPTPTPETFDDFWTRESTS